jgi:hypothetical protein
MESAEGDDWATAIARGGEEVEPLQASARITHLEIGRVAIVSRCDVVGDVAELSAVGSVEGTAQFGLPLERCLRH